ncbi:c-type cytochrome [Undibacterium sp. WLX3042]|uniref:c-type cytochrome n=1 Tax=Undibacterium sp. WLX3042 TaxID=3412686 RepID=UPI003C2ADD81
MPEMWIVSRLYTSRGRTGNMTECQQNSFLAWLLMLTMLLTAQHASAAGNTLAGKTVFASRCASCHQIGASAHGGFAPQLNGVIGRAAGSTTDFKYSPAMKNAKLVWTEKNLRAFLQAPDSVVPGTKMRFYGMSDEQKIADILAYLRSFP